ncbi:MAG: zf-TFIIB domain-containing protein [Myxococcales bacterium]|jgi:Zn-finger nucleic acid-binding protein/cytochrome bd-type quinol oxidase subunit 2
MDARCPTCCTLLSRRNTAGVEYDGCLWCGGLWIDRDELQALAKQPDQLRAVAATFRSGLGRSNAAGRSRECPRCEAPLAQLELDDLSGVQLDHCRRCDGIWLDHGEAEQIVERAVPSAPPAGASSAATVHAVAGAPQPQPDAAAREEHPPSAPASDAAATASETSTVGLPIVRGVVLRELERARILFDTGGGWAFVKAAHRFGLAYPKLFVPVAVVGLVQLALGVAALRAVLVMLDGNQPGAKAFGGWWPLLGLALLGVFLLVLGNCVITGMTANMIDSWTKGREPKLTVAAKDVLKSLWALVVVALRAMVVVLPSLFVRSNTSTSKAREAERRARQAIGALLVPIIIIEDLGFRGALERARSIYYRDLLPIGVGASGLWPVFALPMLLTPVLMGIAFQATAPNTPTSLVFYIFGAGLLLCVALNSYRAFVFGAHDACLYLWTAEAERLGDLQRVKVPELLAKVLEM